MIYPSHLLAHQWRAILLAFLGLTCSLIAAPANLTQVVNHEGQTLTMQLKLTSLRGSNFEVLAHNSSGTYDTVTPVAERSYLGTVDEFPGAVSCGILQDDGQFRGAILFDRGSTWSTLGTNVTKVRDTNYIPENYNSWRIPTTPTVSNGQAGNTTYGFELGMDADFDYYNSTSGGSLARTLENIEYSVAVIRGSYLRDAMLRVYLGRVIIRTSQSQDPYTGLSGGSYLDATRTEWLNNQADTNPDLVAGVSPTKIGGGLAWVGTVGASFKFSVNLCDPTGDFSVVFRHEMGHNWDLPHSVGGNPEGTGFMGGNQSSRMTGCEVYRVFNHRDSKVTQGGILTNEGVFTEVNLPPYASFDHGQMTQVKDSSLAFDVLANDFDANGQAVSISDFTSVSGNGGSITQQGDSLIYTPSGSFIGLDYFYYTISDTSGQTGTGVVVVDVKNPSDLELYLQLDEVGGTVAADSSSKGHTTNIVGTDFSMASITGVFGNALSFDGLNDYALVEGLDETTNTLTLSAWIKPNGLQTDWSGIILTRTPLAGGLNFGTDGELRYQWDNARWGWNSGLVPAQDVWTFVALVIEPSKATIYMNDGSGFVSSTHYATNLPQNLSTFHIGRDPNTGTRSYKGLMDEVRIHTKALDVSELQALADGGTPTGPNPFVGAIDTTSNYVTWGATGNATDYQVYLGTSEAAVAAANTSSPEYVGNTIAPSFDFDLAPNTNYFWRVDAHNSNTTVQGDVWSFTTGPSIGPPALLGHWKLDEGSGTTVTDSSANGNNGTIIGGANWTTGLNGPALSLDGVDDKVALTGLDMDTNKVTFSAWIKPEGLQTSWAGIILSRGDKAAGLQFGTNGELRMQWNDYYWDWNSGLVPPQDTWSFVALVIEPDKATIYLNDGTGFTSAALPTNYLPQSLITASIGQDPSSSSRLFRGDIDDVRILKRVMTQAELEGLYAQHLVVNNQAPSIANATLSVNENQSAGSVVGTATASDPDAGDSLTYSITGGNSSGNFAINSATGQITATGSLNHEANSSYALTVTVTDNGGLSDSAVISINVNDVNEAPVASNASGSVQENSANGTVVTTVSASDPDAGDSLSFSIVGGNDGSFTINPSTGVVSTNAALNHEATSAYNLTVRVTDSGSLTDNVSVNITVLNVNEAPSASNGSAAVAENSPAGTQVHTVVASDPDTSDNLSFAIIGGNDGSFAINSNNGSITTTQALDHEGTSSYALQVSVTDIGGLTANATINVTVTDVNESPQLAGASASIASTSVIGTSVVTVSASDPDNADSLSFAITGGNDGSFAINSASGAIVTAGLLNYDVTPAYNLTVTVTDAGGLSSSAVVSVTLAASAADIQTRIGQDVTDSSATVNVRILETGGQNPTITLYYGPSNGGTTPSAWANSQSLGALGLGDHQAFLSNLASETTYFYTFSATNSGGTVWGGIASLTTEAGEPAKLVRTTIESVSSSTWTTVDLGQTFASAVIVATPIYANNNVAPVVTRIRNVAGSSFELQIARADGQTGAVTCDVSVIAVEEGVYTLAEHGVKMEAVKYTSTITGSKSGWVSEVRSYSNSYTSPVVVGQVMTANDPAWSVFWCHGSTRTDPPSASALSVGKQVAEDPNQTRLDETVGYIVIESGNGTLNGTNFVAGLGSDTVRGTTNSSTGYNYSLSGLSSASAAAISLAGLDGGDGGWAVLFGANPITANQLTLVVDEDQLANDERKHTTEQVGYIVFE